MGNLHYGGSGGVREQLTILRRRPQDSDPESPGNHECSTQN